MAKLSEILTPILTKYNLRFVGTERTSTRPKKHGVTYEAWTNQMSGVAVFIYDDATIGVRDNNVSATVEFDVDVADPKSLDAIENWLKEKVKHGI